MDPNQDVSFSSACDKQREDDVRVLIIEDDRNFRYAINAFLELQGHEVRAAATPDEARANYEQLQPDIVLCDWMLESDVDGADLAAEFLKANPDLRVVMMTGQSVADLQECTESLNIETILRKPVDLRQIDQLLRSAH